MRRGNRGYRWYRLWLVALAVACASASCGAASDSQEPDFLDVSAQLYPKGEAFESNLLLVEEATERCMKSAGFEYTLRTFSFAEQDTLDFPTIGSWTKELADRFGFGMAQIPTQQRLHNAGDFEGLSASELELRNETFTVCSATAFEEVNGRYAEEIAVLRATFDDVRSEFQADPSIVSIQSQWAECMNAQGYQGVESFPQFVSTYLALQDEFLLETGGRDLKARQQADFDDRKTQERAAALAAVDCAEPLAEEYNDVWDEYQARFMSEYEIPALATP